MSIYKYLDLSTGHVTKEDGQLLEDICNSSAPINRPRGIADTGYGWIILSTATDCIDDWETLGLSEAFLSVIRYAETNKCGMVRFDRDGDELDDLPKFDW